MVVFRGRATLIASIPTTSPDPQTIATMSESWVTLYVRGSGLWVYQAFWDVSPNSEPKVFIILLLLVSRIRSPQILLFQGLLGCVSTNSEGVAGRSMTLCQFVRSLSTIQSYQNYSKSLRRDKSVLIFPVYQEVNLTLNDLNSARASV